MSFENTTVNKRKTTNWTLCCLFQQDIRKDLLCPYEKECHHKAYEVLEVDLENIVDNEVSMPLDVNVECLDDGSGIVNTMKTNKVTYHNGCRTLFRSGMLQRQLKKREMDSGNVGAAVSPKKTRLSYKSTLNREKAQCTYCEKYEGEGDEQIYHVSSANCVHARLNTTSNAEDAQAWDIHYHASCYIKLKTEARAATKSSRSTFHQQTYDPLIIAQLLALVKCNNSPQKVVLQGSCTIAETITDDDQANISARLKVACTISQLIYSNSTNQSSQAITLYQRKNREAPFPLYLGLKLHSNDRKKENIQTLHALGISVSYDRIMEVKKQFTQAVCKRWQQDGVIVPTNIKRKVFMTTLVDDIDESSRYKLHGTAMSLTSHSAYDNIGKDPKPLTLDVSEFCTDELPDGNTHDCTFC
ncbi:hypothetical protein FQA39_LY04876 [Lamprigera yunnana]|nr:hypothetical protein FQA39_LY04876 [Lamprigera yunnana]